MATGTNGIITRSEMINHVADRVWKGGSDPGKSDQCVTAGWIRDNLASDHVWNYSGTYPTDSQCVKASHIWSGSSEFIVFNKYQYPVNLEVWASGGAIYSSHYYQLSIAPTNNQLYINSPKVTLQNTAISSSGYKQVYVSDGWGKAIQGLSSTGDINVVLNGNSVQNYYVTKTISSKSIPFDNHTMRFIIYINVGSGSQPLSLGTCSLMFNN